MTRLFRKTMLLLLLLIATTTMLWAEEAVKISAPPEGKAQIVFMRPTPGVTKSTIFDVTSSENKVIGTLKSRKKLIHTIDPGEYTFMVYGMNNADFMKAKVEAGKTYYVLVQTRIAFWGRRYSLVPIRKIELNGEKFKEWNKSTKLIKINQQELDSWVAKHMKNIQEKRERYFVKWNRKTDAAKERYLMHADDGR